METAHRHQLVFVSPGAWQEAARARHDFAGEPLVVGWAQRGWPLMARRRVPGDGHGVSLGLPLPPNLGKRRLAVTLDKAAVVASAPPPRLVDAARHAPDAWQGTLRDIAALTQDLGVTARVFGSLAWQAITGLAYVTATSDVDLLLPLPATGDALGRLLDGLAAIEASMRLDGEVVRHDGAAVNWRELHGGADELLVKSTAGAAMISRTAFLGAAAA